jgi:hypothetical protein
MNVIKLSVGYMGDDDVIYLPLEDNLDNENVETFEELKQKWEKLKWGYYGKASVDLISLEVAESLPSLFVNMVIGGATPEQTAAIETLKTVDLTNTSKCSEFDIWCFTDLMIDPEFYSRPFDKNPESGLYSCQFAVDCMKGDVYSKDFRYFECDQCNRTICEQNPSNGWHVQYRFIGDVEQVCLKCYEEQMFSEGVDLDDVIENKTLEGMFFNTKDLENNGFEVVEQFDHCVIGSGRFGGYIKPEHLFDRLKQAKEDGLFNDKIVIINYEDMAIGGFGGTVSVWMKNKSEKPQ